MTGGSPPAASTLPAGCDVLIAGGGIAGLCAALAARHAGATVLVLDAAPPDRRGGNSRHSRNLRIRHDAPSSLFPGRYDDADFAADLAQASAGGGDPALGRLMIAHSAELPDWLRRQGVVFQTVEGGGLPWSRKTAFFLGGGTAMINALHATALRRGIVIRHRVEVIGLEADGTVTAVPDGAPPARIHSGAVVVASGGYQANRDWLRRRWGAVADALVVRGTPEALGRPLKALFDLGAAAAGLEGEGHLVAVDGRLTAADGGIVTRVDGLAAGIAVDRDGQRFTDETAITGPTRYAAWGREIAARPGAIAFAVWDATGFERTPPMILPPWRAKRLDDLAARIGVDPSALATAAAASGRVGAAPFFAVPIRPGITFTSHGVRVDARARVIAEDGRPFPRLFAAGTTMAPAVLGTGYLAGAALTIAGVFGRIAGEEAARHVLG